MKRPEPMIVCEHSECRSAKNRGFALVLTLLVLVMLTVLVVGFNAATRTEQMAARNFTNQTVAGQMADLSVSRAMGLLGSAVTNGVITQPGRAWSPDAGSIDLSSQSFGDGPLVNLNVRQIDGTNTNYSIATNTDVRFFNVPLIDVMVRDTVIGRYAFWIDDDGSKMNLNAAWTNARTNFLATNARPFSMAVFTNLPNVSAANLSPSNFASLVTNTTQIDTTTATNGWSYFFTPRQLMMLPNLGRETYQKLMFQTAGGPGNQARGTFAFAPGGAPGALEVGGGAGMLSSASVGGNPNYTRRYATLLQALDEVAGRYLGGAQYAKYFGPNKNLRSKYGPDITRQIIANINDAVLPAAATAYTGATAAEMLAGSDSSGPNNPVPRAVLGLRPSPFLNEIAIAVAQSTNSPPAEIQIWMDCELVDPYQTGEGAGWEIKYKIRTLRFSGSYDLDGVTQSFQNPARSIDWNWDGGNRSVTITNAVAANGYLRPSEAFAFEWQVGDLVPPSASNVVFTQVEVEPVLTVLRRTPGDVSTVRDWAISNDFPADHFVFTTIPSVQQELGFNGYGPFPPPPGVAFDRGIAKNDPRVRRFTSYDPPSAAWIAVGGANNPPVTLGAANPTVNFTNGTGIPGVQNDLAVGVNNIYEHPSFGAGAPTQIIPQWISAFDLSRVHTGLQWRTLQFRSQDVAERVEDLVPDWALLEAFTVSNSVVPVSTKLNVNSLAYPAAATQSPAALLAAGLARPLPIAGLFAGNTNRASATNAAISGVNLGIPEDAAFSTSGTNSFLAVASNVTRLAFTRSWGGNRPDNLPTNALGLLAEVLEINGVANVGDNEGVREGRARGFYDALAASSDVFTVYSVGQAIDPLGRVAGERFLRTQVARDPANPTRFKVIFSEPLNW
jgi:hypothetical protein